jgi:TolA-binding protein
MKEGLNALRILFFANLLRGQRDAPEIIETDRENDEVMTTELTKRRQQRTDDAGDNEEQAQTEQQPSSNENTPEATATTPDGTRNRSTRTSTSEKDEIESSYENSLQKKLDLKLNEYRHGEYPFNDFVNEYANEKIEIRKEYLDFIQRTTNTIQFSFIFYPFFLSTINKIGNLNMQTYS